MCLCSIAAFILSKSVLAKLYICCLCRSAVFFLFASQYTQRFFAQGDSMPHRCLATGRWGAACRRPDTEMARDLAPCPLPGVMKNRQVDMTKIVIVMSLKQVHIFMHRLEKAALVILFELGLLAGELSFCTRIHFLLQVPTYSAN